MFLSLNDIEATFRTLAGLVPLEVFVFFGALIEELVAPIPSMIVMTTAGFFAQLEGRTGLFIVWLVALGNIGKLIGSFLYYTIGDKLEDVVVGRFGHYLGLRHADVERIGKYFNGTPWRDGALIFLVRIIPIFPTILVSIAAGVVRIRTRVFLTASYLGNFSKDLFYAFAGYYGVQALWAHFRDIERVRFGVGMLLVITLVGIIIMLYVYRHHGLRLFRRFRTWLQP